MNRITQSNGSTNLRELAYDHIRTKLLDGRISPGTRISSRALAREIGVSFIPVREAIAQLASEGLVDHEAGVGTFGTRVGRDDLRELYELREALELHAMSFAARRIDEDVLAQMRSANATLRAIAAKRRAGISAPGLGSGGNAKPMLSSLDRNGFGGPESTILEPHSSNGHGANGHGANGHGANGHGANGHGANGNGNGHGSNGNGNGHGNGHGTGAFATALPSSSGNGEPQRSSMDADLVAWNRADVEFHMAFVRAAGNTRLVRSVQDVRTLIQVACSQDRLRPTDDLERTCDHHQALIEALAARDEASALRVLAEDIRFCCKSALDGHPAKEVRAPQSLAS